MRYVLQPGAKKSATPLPEIKLQLQPLLAGRDFHGTIQDNWRPAWTVAQENAALALAAHDCPVKLFVTHNAERFNLNACWWYNFTYRMERQRGYPDREDLWTPGMLEYTLTPGVPVGFIASTAVVPWTDHLKLLAAAKERHAKFAQVFAKTDPKDEFLSTLSVAADQFVVQRRVTSDKRSVIAGYPWFEDWGRDTFISLPGLALVTGRHEIAKSILSTFADHMRRGAVAESGFRTKARGRRTTTRSMRRCGLCMRPMRIGGIRGIRDSS